MELKIKKITKKNGQAWITCELDGRYVALLHVVDEKLASAIHNPKSICIDHGEAKEVQARLKKRNRSPINDAKAARFRMFDLLFGNRDHSIPKAGCRTKGNSAAWHKPPYSHMQPE